MPTREPAQQPNDGGYHVASNLAAPSARRRETDPPALSQQTQLQKDAIERSKNPEQVAAAAQTTFGAVPANAKARDDEYFVARAFAVDGVFYTRENARDLAQLDGDVLEAHVQRGNIVRNPARVTE